MSNFKDVKKKIIEDGLSSKKTFSESLFNQLGTAILNDEGYERTVASMKDGELKEETVKPIGELRKQLIGSVAQAAGCDAAEQGKLVEEHQFPTLSLYPFVDSTIKEYMKPDVGKRYVFGRENNIQASMEFVEQEACIKDVSAPGSTVSKKQRQGAYLKLKAKSTCPDNLREDIPE